MNRSKRRGISLIEVTVLGMVLVVLMGGLFSAFISIDGFNRTAVTMPQVQEAAQKMTLGIAADIRRASLATAADTGYTLNAGVEGAAVRGLTVYSRSGGTLHKIAYATGVSVAPSPGNITKSVDGGAATVAYPDSTIAFTYFVSSGHSYHGTTLTPYTPTSSTTPDLIAVKVVGTSQIGGMTATYTTLVRLRNGPLKTGLFD